VTHAALDIWANAADALCGYACGWDDGRGKDDPVYAAVTEGRDVPPNRAHYSSCGDLAHWLLERLGVREPWVNRASLGHYVVGANVWELASCPVHIVPGQDYMPAPGDILEIWNTPIGSDAHVCVALSVPVEGQIRLANYGVGGMLAVAWPGAHIADSPWRPSTAGHYIGTRRLQRVVQLASIIPLSSAPVDLSGAIVTPELTAALKGAS
jgi:hypothetical protein